MKPSIRLCALLCLLSSHLFAQNYNITRTDDYQGCTVQKTLLTADSLIAYIGSCSAKALSDGYLLYYAVYNGDGNLLYQGSEEGMTRYNIKNAYALPDGGIFLDCGPVFCDPFEVPPGYEARRHLEIQFDAEIFEFSTFDKGIWNFGHGVTPSGRPYVLNNFALHIMGQGENYLSFAQIGNATMLSDSTLLAVSDSTRYINFLTEEVLFTTPRITECNDFRTISYEERTWICGNDNYVRVFQDTSLLAELDLAAVEVQVQTKNTGGTFTALHKTGAEEYKLTTYNALGVKTDSIEFTVRQQIDVHSAVRTTDTVFYGGHTERIPEACNRPHAHSVLGAIYPQDTTFGVQKDLSVSHLSFIEPVEVFTRYTSPAPEVYWRYFSYAFEDVWVTVTNTGTTPVDSFELCSKALTADQETYNQTCTFSDNYQQTVTLPEPLAPGASHEIFVGDLYIIQRDDEEDIQIPALEFWTYAPDGQVDADLSDDRLCLTDYNFEFIVSQTTQSTSRNLKIFPNPAAAYISLELPTDESLTYQIFASDGTLQQQGHTSNGEQIATDRLAPGVYFVEIEGGRGQGWFVRL